jgi:hypothetical protein
MAKTFRLVIHKWEFAILIAVVNIIAAYVVPYVVGYFLSGFAQTVVDSIVTLALNLLVVWLSIEEQNAPDLPKPQ